VVIQRHAQGRVEKSFRLVPWPVAGQLPEETLRTDGNQILLDSGRAPLVTKELMVTRRSHFRKSALSLRRNPKVWIRSFITKYFRGLKAHARIGRFGNVGSIMKG